VIARGTFSLVDPLLADTVTECVPAFALLTAVSLSIFVPDPGAARIGCVNDAEIVLGNPLMEKATGALKPPLTVTVRVVLSFEPAVTEREFGDADA
jgi:hypothetical protein